MTDPAVSAQLRQLLDQAPRDADAICYDGAWWTWGDLAAVAARLEQILGVLGLGAGARVGLVLSNRREHAAVITAVLAGQRCLTTLSPLQPPERLGKDVHAAALPVVLASPEVLADPLVGTAVRAHGTAVVLGADGTLTVDGGATSAPEARTYLPGTGIEMLTSGTTGPPKRVPLGYPQIDMALASGGMRPREGAGGADLLGTGVSLVATPMVHIGGMWGLVATLFAGRRAVLLDRFTVDGWAEAVRTHRPKASGLVPAAMRAVLDAQVPAEDLSSLQVVTSGTTFCPPDLADEFTQRYGIAVLMTYGATEFAGALAGWTLPLQREWWTTKRGSAGRPFRNVSMRVVGPEGAELPAGSVGVLEVRTPQSPQGPDAWVRTSDLARLDDDGFVWIEGRADDAIIRGGFKVQPATVRAVLERHPAVREAAVTGRPDTRLGAVPVAAVELVPGATAPTPDELRALCREHLTPYEVPVAFLAVDELPRTPSHKVSRVDLLELFRD